MTFADRRRALIGAQSYGFVANFTRVGDPQIVDGVMTPSSDSWITTPSALPSGPEKWELVFKINKHRQQGYINLIIGAGILIQVTSNLSGHSVAKLYLRSVNGSSFDITNGGLSCDLYDNTPTYIRIGYNGSNYYFGTSNDGATYSDTNLTSSLKLRGGGTVSFGPKLSNTEAVDADYYLYDTYIKTGDSVWWTPYK